MRFSALKNQGISRLAEKLSAFKELLWLAELVVYLFPYEKLRCVRLRGPEFRNCYNIQRFGKRNIQVPVKSAALKHIKRERDLN
jgi:hypothetical protein